MMDFEPVFSYTLRIIHDEENKQKQTKAEERPPTANRRCKTCPNNLTIQQKYEVLQLIITEKKSIKYVLKKYKCGLTQIYGILKNKVEITDRYLNGAGPSKKSRITKNADVNEVTHRWCSERLEEGLPVSGFRLQQVALHAAEILQVHEFKASTGWLRSFRKNYKINIKSKHSPNVSNEELEECKQKVMEIIDDLKNNDDDET